MRNEREVVDLNVALIPVRVDPPNGIAERELLIWSIAGELELDVSLAAHAPRARHAPDHVRARARGDHARGMLASYRFSRQLGNNGVNFSHVSALNAGRLTTALAVDVTQRLGSRGDAALP